jgi:hypothetical protein
MPFKNKEDRKKYNKLYYQANKDIIKEKNKKKREEIENIKETMKKLLNIL